MCRLFTNTRKNLKMCSTKTPLEILQGERPCLERVLVPDQILVKWSETNSLGVKLGPFLSYGSLAKWEQESLTLGTRPTDSLFLMGSDTYVVFIQEAQYRWALALGYPNDLSTGSRSRVLGAFMLIAKTLENHLKWPKQFVFLGQYMFLHFFQQVKDYFLPCDYLKNTNLTCILLGVMWSGNCVWK